MAYDTATGARTGSWTIGTNLGAIDLSVDQRYLVVTERDLGPRQGNVNNAGYEADVYRLELATGTVRTFTRLTGADESSFFDVSFLANGDVLLTQMINFSAFNPLVRLDVAAGTFATIGTYNRSSTLTATPDRSQVLSVAEYSFSPSAQLYDGGSGSLTSLANSSGLGTSVNAQAISPNGQIIAEGIDFGGLAIFDRQFNLLVNFRTDEWQHAVTGLAFSPAGDKLYVLNAVSNQVVVFSTRDWATLAAYQIDDDIANGVQFGNRLLASADGMRLAVQASIAAHVIDLRLAVPTGATSGNDRMVATGGGYEAIFAYGGNDTLEGDGYDTLIGGTGDDVYVVSSPGVQIAESNDAGWDVIRSSAEFYYIPENVEELVLTGNQAISATGSFWANRITGNDANNVISGAAGNDTIYGRGGDDHINGDAGADSMIGGAGNDVYIVDDVGDVVVEDANDGVDTVHVDFSGSTFRLPANVENARTISVASIEGNALDNRLSGWVGDDTLLGADGADTLFGDEGRDVLSGGAGADVFVYRPEIYSSEIGVDTILDFETGVDIINLVDVRPTSVGFRQETDAATGMRLTIVEAATPGGLLRIRVHGLVTSSDVRRDANVPGATDGNDLLRGTSSNDTLSGLAGADTLLGLEGDDRLDGGAGDDILDGGPGADTMIGGAGDDSYVVRDNGLLVPVWGDTVVELPGEGNDIVFTSVNFTLGLDASVETLSTERNGEANNLTLTGNSFAQAIIGDYGANLLDGGGGADTLAGLLGDDTYLIDDPNVTILEIAGGGNDMVRIGDTAGRASWTLTAGAEVELLQAAAGSAAINITGNGFAQQIEGNDGNNILNGGGGNDTLVGFGGDDTYLVRELGSVVIEGNGGGTDTVFTTVSYNLGVNEVEVLSTVTNADTVAIDLIGNFATQRVIGNYGNNILNGGSGGADTLIGLLGNDVYAAGSQSITIVENANEGSDTLVVFADYQIRTGVSIEVFAAQNRGGTEAFTLRGNEVAQTAIGNAGDNVIDGRGGSDVLIGDAGADTFAFTTALGAGNVDTILDFGNGADRIALASDVFAAVAGGVTAGAFVIGTAATDADDRLIYDQASGRLFYDADGNGAGAAVQFAQLAAGTALTAASFTIVAPVTDLA